MSQSYLSCLTFRLNPLGLDRNLELTVQSGWCAPSALVCAVAEVDAVTAGTVLVAVTTVVKVGIRTVVVSIPWKVDMSASETSHGLVIAGAIGTWPAIVSVFQ